MSPPPIFVRASFGSIQLVEGNPGAPPLHPPNGPGDRPDVAKGGNNASLAHGETIDPQSSSRSRTGCEHRPDRGCAVPSDDISHQKCCRARQRAFQLSSGAPTPFKAACSLTTAKRTMAVNRIRYSFAPHKRSYVINIANRKPATGCCSLNRSQFSIYCAAVKLLNCAAFLEPLNRRLR